MTGTAWVPGSACRCARRSCRRAGGGSPRSPRHGSRAAARGSRPGRARGRSGTPRRSCRASRQARVVAAGVALTALGVRAALQAPERALRSGERPRILHRPSGGQDREMPHARVNANHRPRRRRGGIGPSDLAAQRAEPSVSVARDGRGQDPCFASVELAAQAGGGLVRADMPDPWELHATAARHAEGPGRVSEALPAPAASLEPGEPDPGPGPPPCAWSHPSSSARRPSPPAPRTRPPCCSAPTTARLAACGRSTPGAAPPDSTARSHAPDRAGERLDPPSPARART
jgi:hypothetical protein